MPAPGALSKNTKLLPVILTCIPYTLAAFTCWMVAHSSQKRKELYIHTALPAFIGGALGCWGFVLWGLGWFSGAWVLCLGTCDGPAHSSQKRKELYIHKALPAFIGCVLGLCALGRAWVLCFGVT
jgi:hypothetical protein